MTRPCPCCGGSGEAADEVDDIEARVDALREDCLALGIVVGVGATIAEDGCARLLDRSPKTLRHWRGTDCPIRFVSIRGRIRYRLTDIAAFLAQEVE